MDDDQVQIVEDLALRLEEGLEYWEIEEHDPSDDRWAAFNLLVGWAAIKRLPLESHDGYPFIHYLEVIEEIFRSVEGRALALKVFSMNLPLKWKARCERGKLQEGEVALEIMLEDLDDLELLGLAFEEFLPEEEGVYQDQMAGTVAWVSESPELWSPVQEKARVMLDLHKSLLVGGDLNLAGFTLTLRKFSEIAYPETRTQGLKG